MKKYLFASILLMAFTAPGLRTATGTLTPNERKFAIDYYQNTKARLLSDVNGLSDAKHTTEELITMTTDRSRKAQAPEMLKPGSQFPNEAAALNAFVLRRDSTIAYTGTTNDDLKDHFITHPVFGTMDLYQGLVLLAAHSARHTLQIEEVMASPGFPKN